MKNLTRLLALIFVLFFANSILAGTEQTFNVYILNQSPFNIYLGDSYWNKTPLFFLARKVPSATPFEKIAIGETINNSATIAFYAHAGEGIKNYEDTPVITYSFGSSNSLKMDPPWIRINGIRYNAQVIHASKDSNDIILNFFPMNTNTIHN